MSDMKLYSRILFNLDINLIILCVFATVFATKIHNKYIAYF